MKTEEEEIKEEKLLIKNKEKNKNKISISMGYANGQINKNRMGNYFNILKTIRKCIKYFI